MRTIFKKLKKVLKYFINDFKYKPEKKYLRGKKEL